MRRAAKTDLNQQEIVNALRQIGCSVAVTSSLGNGFCDLCVGYRGRNLLVEVKSPGGRLTDDQVKFRDNWKGQYSVVESIAEAVDVVTKDESVYRNQKAAMINREQKKIACVASPMGDSYTVTVNDGKSVVEVVFPCSDPFEAIKKIIQYVDSL